MMAKAAGAGRMHRKNPRMNATHDPTASSTKATRPPMPKKRSPQQTNRAAEPEPVSTLLNTRAPMPTELSVSPKAARMLPSAMAPAAPHKMKRLSESRSVRPKATATNSMVTTMVTSDSVSST